jgi:hypothetical protein
MQQEEETNTEAEAFVEASIAATIADALIALCDADLFVTAEGEAYADIQVNGHRETYQVESKPFRDYLRHKYFKAMKKSCNPESLKQAIDTIAMQARHPEKGEPVVRKVHLRIAEHDAAIYIDLGDAAWGVVKVTASGWKVIANPPVRFTRSKTMRPLPVPQKGGDYRPLKDLVNAGDDEFLLIIGFVLAALRPLAAQPVLILSGEHGSAKTTLVNLISRFIDPRSPEQRSPPRSEDDLIVAARHTHLLAFDNLSGISDWLSDGISRRPIP